MLRSIKDMQGHEILAQDGEIGSVHSFYFDDKGWQVRYLVIDTGNWLSNQKVLIPTTALRQPQWDAQKLPVALTKEQVENSPSLDTARSAIPEQETELDNSIGGPPIYRLGGGLFEEENIGMQPESIVETIKAKEQAQKQQVAKAQEGSSHLRNTRHTIGYYIQAQDGDIGHLEDFIVDDESWTIRYAVVDTRNWLPGKKVLVAPAWIEQVDWTQSKVYIDLSQEAIQNSPEYDPSTPVSREYETQLHHHYDRQKYWS